jgi:exodeoxyribonuclease III
MTAPIEHLLDIVGKEVLGLKVPVVDLIAVQTQDPFKVLVATILSARTKDETTAQAAKRLFKHAPDQQGLAALPAEKIAKLIYPVGFYRNKAKYLVKLPQALEAFGNTIPDTVEQLVTLPGVGRKTANLVVSVAFQKPAICVDTHVHRIMNIWGYVKTKDPLQTEMALRKKLPKKYWIKVNSLLVAFGQAICRPVAPHCDRCALNKVCPQIGVTPRKTPKKRTPKGKNHKKFISWNVNGIRAMEKKGFVNMMQEFDADIIAIQETKAHPDQLSDSLLNIPGYTSYWNSAERKGYSGVAVYSRTSPVAVNTGLNILDLDREGRVQTLEFQDFFFVNIYFPNAGHGLKRLDFKINFNRAVQEYATALATKKAVVICGDYNVAHKAIDLKNPGRNEANPGFTPEERQWMDTFLENGFLDTFRMFNTDPGHYTWWSYRFNARARDIGWRIDYFCVDKNSHSRVANASILKDVMGSDHCPVQLDFSVDKINS